MIAVGSFALAGNSSTQKPDITVLIMHLQQFFTCLIKKQSIAEKKGRGRGEKQTWQAWQAWQAWKAWASFKTNLSDFQVPGVGKVPQAST